MVIASMPHFEFLDDSSLLVNCLFSGALGASVGSIIYVVINEIVKYLKD